MTPAEIATLNALVDGGWSDPDNRAVLEDWYADRGADAARTVRAFDAAADAAARRRLNRFDSEDKDMTPGLKIIKIRMTYYWTATIVGWVRRVAGDEYVILPGARMITRKNGEGVDWNGMDVLASAGPGTKYKLTAPSKAEEEIHRLGPLSRVKKASVEPRRKDCPQPADWNER